MRWTISLLILLLAGGLLAQQPDTPPATPGQKQIEDLQNTVRTLQMRIAQLEQRIRQLESGQDRWQLPPGYQFRPRPDPFRFPGTPQQPFQFKGTPLPNGGFFRPLTPTSSSPSQQR